MRPKNKNAKIDFFWRFSFYAYIPSINELSFSKTTLLLILRVGVISPFSIVNSSGRSLNFLIFSSIDRNIIKGTHNKGAKSTYRQAPLKAPP